MERGRHRFVEHGGEVEAELAAADEAGIFAAGLDAFTELVAGGRQGEPDVRRIELEGRDPGLLLADWLDELLFLAEVEEFVPTEVTSIEVDESRLRATVAGVHGRPRPLVKGVALGGLVVEERGGGWHGRVVFDV